MQSVKNPCCITDVTASQLDKLAFSSPYLKLGIFNYYLMKGIEGDADENKDKIKNKK